MVKWSLIIDDYTSLPISIVIKDSLIESQKTEQLETQAYVSAELDQTIASKVQKPKLGFQNSPKECFEEKSY